jgi:hypothetical protein
MSIGCDLSITYILRSAPALENEKRGVSVFLVALNFVIIDEIILYGALEVLSVRSSAAFAVVFMF